jgi:hypothetical protein
MKIPVQISRWIAAAAGLVAFFRSTPASADPPATANSIRIALGFRYGFSLEEGDFNPWGTGLGIAGGYTLPNAIYIGGDFDYFFGDKIENGGFKQTGNIWQVMAEGGYDLGLGGNFVVRPKVGVGTAGLKSELCAPPLPCVSGSETDLAVAPGATFLVLTSKVSLALDLRYDLIFADPKTIKALILSAGVGF